MSPFAIRQRDYQRFLILVCLQKLKGTSVVELKNIIVFSLKQYLLVDHDDIVEKIDCFGANRA